MERLALAVVALLLLPAALADGPAPDAPLAVVAMQDSPTTVLVSWVPGIESPDSYVIYGYENGTPVKLAAVSSSVPPSLDVPAGYAAYGVSAVSGAGASAAIITVMVPTEASGGYCVWVSATPPSYVIGTPADCIGMIESRNHVMGTVNLP